MEEKDRVYRMEPSSKEAARFGYTVEREFLGEISAEELILRLIRRHPEGMADAK